VDGHHAAVRGQLHELRSGRARRLVRRRLLSGGQRMLSRTEIVAIVCALSIAFAAAIAPRHARATDKIGSFNVASSTANTTSALGSAITTTTQVLGLSGASLS